MEGDRYCFGERSLATMEHVKQSLEAMGKTCTVSSEVVAGKFTLYTLTAVDKPRPSRKERGL